MVSKETQNGFIKKAERAAEWMYWLALAIVLNFTFQLSAYLFPEVVTAVFGKWATEFWSLNLGICVVFLVVGWGITAVQTYHLRRALGLPR